VQFEVLKHRKEARAAAQLIRFTAGSTEGCTEIPKKNGHLEKPSGLMLKIGIQGEIVKVFICADRRPLY
jgi:hypothetical protein